MRDESRVFSAGRKAGNDRNDNASLYLAKQSARNTRFRSRPSPPASRLFVFTSGETAGPTLRE